MYRILTMYTIWENRTSTLFQKYFFKDYYLYRNKNIKIYKNYMYYFFVKLRSNRGSKIVEIK